MLNPGMRAGLLGLGLAGLVALPAAAQSWPSDSGPTGDYLGATVRQFDRLSPPPVEAGGRGERPVPDMPVTDLPGGSVNVGVPAVVSAPREPMARTRSRRSTSRPTPHQRLRSASAASQGPRDREARMERELERQGRRIQELERQIEQDRQRPADSRGSGLSGGNSATVTSR